MTLADSSCQDVIKFRQVFRAVISMDRIAATGL